MGHLANGIDFANALCIPERASVEFKYALDFTTRVVEEKLCYQKYENTIRRFNINLSDNFRAHAYVRAILGLSTDMSLLRDAAIYFYEHNFPPKQKVLSQDPMDQQRLLQSIHMALIGQQFDIAAEWLVKAHKFTQHAPEVRLLTTFMNNEQQNRWDDNRQFQPEFDDFFDRCRNFGEDVDGFFSPGTIYQFEMALLRDKYLIAEDHQINWQRAMLSVGE